jgi:2-polyprenyl-6-methoxyphenol hydroxylase-like FAD-dependent oxidoreductase
MAERVLVLGAGMAGLCVALALAPTGRSITILDRDPPPPEGGAEAVFDHWTRRGVGHLRQSHAFLARLHKLIETEHPRLLEQIRALGGREFRFADGLPATIAANYVAEPGDDEMTIIISRRTTLELAIRRYVEQQPGVTIRPEVFVDGLLTRNDERGALIARAFRSADGEEVDGDIVVDAAGRTSPIVDWLEAAGAVSPPEDVEDCSILYYTRFYRLLPGQAEPARGRFSTTGDLGFLKFGVFPGDAGTFSITLAVPEVEHTLRMAVMRPETFDAVCAALPGVAPWTDAARSEPVSRVHGMGNLRSRWRESAPGGAPAALNLFSVGDSLVLTNPLFGRGCSFAAVEAHLLRDVLEGHADPVERARRYGEAVREELRPFFDDMRQQDRSAARRALRGLDPHHKPSLWGRLLRSFVEDGLTIAMRRDVRVLRAAMRAFHMLAPPRAWLNRPATLATVLGVWARGRRANAKYYAEKPGPPRGEMLARLDLPIDADLQRIRAA